MIKYKNSHDWGLDFILYNAVKKLDLRKNVFLYIWDYAHCLKDPPINYYNDENNANNTYNFDFNCENCNKIYATIHSVKFGFGDSSKFNKNNRIVIKTIDHKFVKHNDLKYQTHEIQHKDIDKYDKNIFKPFKLLKNNQGEELNIYVFRNLETKEVHLFSLMRVIYLKNGINMKYNKDGSWSYIYVLSEEFKNKFIEFVNEINFDYGRIELIDDIELGWCIIDVNNSPSIPMLNTTWYLDKTKKNIIPNNIELITSYFKKTLPI